MTPRQRLRQAPPAALADAASRNATAAVAHCYTVPYYLEDCAGTTRPPRRPVSDPRLAVAALADVGPGGRVLDVGCGRGELTYHFAQRGCHVTAVDYAAEAIALARACFAADDPALTRVRFVQGDVNTVALDGPYDVVAAADVIEHLADHELERLYARLAGVLAPGGRVVVHTFRTPGTIATTHRARAAAPLPPAAGCRPTRAAHASSA
jgi:2-polyprenyl-3-methyl-5-hydroxy-6-metoxy-1,4-benzoquinol methylase